MPTAPQLRAKLIEKLQELFQLDQPELDFGFYRIMHAKAEQVQRFLENDLLNEVQQAFADGNSGRQAELKQAYEDAVAQARKFGAPDPEKVEAVQDAKAAYENALDTTKAEAEVYDHLYRFFERYYEDGDFVSRRYLTRETAGKAAPYAVPYDGQEVMLHWANRDQYYIKTSEHFDNYTFDAREAARQAREEAKKNKDQSALELGDDLLQGDPLRVHFRIVAAAEGEHNNVKESDKRYFIVDINEPLTFTESGELLCRFTFRPDPEKSGQEGTWRQKRNALNEAALLDSLNALAKTDKRAVPYVALLGSKAPTGKQTERTLLGKYLEKYSATNSKDYFIHKKLGEFLNRELDFYLKNEVMRLDDLEGAEAPRVEHYLAKLKVIRRIAHKLIDFLAQLENFQKRLWLKKKFVVDSNWCITLDRLAPEVYDALSKYAERQVVCHDGVQRCQREEWVEMYGIDQSQADLAGSVAYTIPLTKEFFQANGHLVLDTAYLSEEEKSLVLASMMDLDQACNGILVHGDNFNALRLVNGMYRGQVRCTYIDPPFNTEQDGFLYKDSYKHSSWLSMMYDTTTIAFDMLQEDGTLYAHIDYEEKERLRLLLDEKFSYITEIIWRIGWLSGYKTKANKFIRNHDTIYQFGKTDKPLFIKSYIPYPEGYVRRDGNPPEGEGYPLEDTWNCYDIDQLNSIQIVSFSKEKVGNEKLTQKNEALLERMLRSSSLEGDVVLDFFLGSGTTAAAAYKMGRRFIGIEMGEHFVQYALPRMKRALYGDKYGISSSYGFPKGGAFQYIRLESYEDTLNALEMRTDEEREKLLAANKGLREDYTLRYLLDVETQGSASLLNHTAFTDPRAYTLNVKRPGSEERTTKTVDLLETFNYLLGLRVQHMAAPEAFTAAFERVVVKDVPKDSPQRLVVKGSLKPEADGKWWFRKVQGWMPRDRHKPHGERDKVLIIWRTLTGDLEQDNAVLDTYFAKNRIEVREKEYDVIYVNGSNNLPNLLEAGERWKVRLIEDDFHRLMWEGVE